MFLRLVYFLLILCYLTPLIASNKSDSLRQSWNNSELPDSSRLKSLHQLAWGKVFSQPDSARYYANIQLDFAKKNLLVKQQSDALNTIGVALYLQGELKKALSAYEQSFKIRKEIDDKRGMCSSLNNMGIIYKDQQAYDKALDCYRKSIALWKEIGDKKGLLHPYGNMGILYMEKGNPEKALEYYNRSLSILKEIDDKQGMAQVLSNIALVYREKGNIKRSLEFHHRSLKLEEEIGNKRGMAASYGNIGTILNEQGDNEKGLEYFEKSLKLFKKAGSRQGMAENYNNIALIYLQEKWHEQALDYHQRALELYAKIGDKQGMAETYNNIGSVYGRKEIPDSAIHYHQKALELFSEIQTKKGIADSYNFLGNIHLKKRNADIALEFGKRSLSLARELGFPGQIRNAARLASRAYRQKQNWKKALELNDLYIDMRDSINNEQTRRAAIRQQLEYSYEKKATADSIRNAEQAKVKDARLAQQKAQLEQERTQRIALYSGLGLVAIFSLFLFNRFQVTRRQKKIIEGQKKEVEEKNNMMTDSIRYAQRIQDALLKSEEHISKHLPPHFIFYQPKDIVSGDFYWSMEKENFLYLAVADCTGHGVPGAFLTMLGTSYLNEINTHEELLSPGEILNQLRDKFIRELSQTNESGSKDGMDISMIKIDLKSGKAKWAGANNPLWIIRKGSEQIEEIKPDKQPIGFYHSPKPFTNHSLRFYQNDQLFLFSDGYADQFGGPKGKKYKYNNFKELLLSAKDEKMEKKKKLLIRSFNDWKGNLEQVDDICVVGLQI